jgi:hypothetical protein
VPDGPKLYLTKNNGSERGVRPSADTANPMYGSRVISPDMATEPDVLKLN